MTAERMEGMMPSKYWIRLYHEILNDRKMVQLSDHLYRRTIEIFLMAGEHHQEGVLPTLDDMAWVLRIEPELLETDFRELGRVGIVEQRDGRWYVVNFSKRQVKMSKAEYMKRLRDQRKKEKYYQPSDQPVTVGNTDIDIDIDIDKEVDKDISTSSTFQEIRKVWAEQFPDKPLPRANNKTLAGKTATRIASTHFKDNWEKALVRAGQSSFLRSGKWFSLGWFLLNDNNYEKCLDGNYDDSIGPNGSVAEPAGFAAGRKILEDIKDGRT